jgi:hypothetical protein
MDPVSVPVPLPLSAKLTVLGSFPDTLNAGVGVPVARTVKLNGRPLGTESDEALTIRGATWAGTAVVVVVEVVEVVLEVVVVEVEVVVVEVVDVVVVVPPGPGGVAPAVPAASATSWLQ